MCIDKLQKGQVKLLEQTMRLSEELKELKQLILKLWGTEDIEKGANQFNWPFDEHGKLLSNTDTTGRLN